MLTSPPTTGAPLSLARVRSLAAARTAAVADLLEAEQQVVQTFPDTYNARLRDNPDGPEAAHRVALADTLSSHPGHPVVGAYIEAGYARLDAEAALASRYHSC